MILRFAQDDRGSGFATCDLCAVRRMRYGLREVESWWLVFSELPRGLAGVHHHLATTCLPGGGELRFQEVEHFVQAYSGPLHQARAAYADGHLFTFRCALPLVRFGIAEQLLADDDRSAGVGVR